MSSEIQNRVSSLSNLQKGLLRQRLLIQINKGEEAYVHKRLVAFIKPNKQESKLTEAELRLYAEGKLPQYMVPSAFQFVESFPLNSNGKVDKQALSGTVDSIECDHSSPSLMPDCLGDEAQRLKQIWQQYLGRKDIGYNDDFFQIGGDSLLAIQMIGAASKSGIEIKVSDFFSQPTISALVSIARKEKPDATVSGKVNHERSELIIPLRTEGSLPPLFLVHELASTIFMYRELTRYLPEDQPVYAIQPASIHFENIGEMARRYYREIRKTYPDGPFHIGGYCFGGHVAFEMACQESETGNPPLYLVIIDGMLMDLVRYRPKYLWEFLKRQTPASIARRLNVKSRDLLKRLKRVLLEGSGFKDEVTDRYDISGLPDELQGRITLNFRAQRDFRPQKHSGDMTLITTPSIYSEIDPYTGWDRVVKGKISVHCVNAGHNSIMNEPHIQETGKCISKDLLKFSRIM